MAGPSLYYGMNALSHNVIMADRKKLKSANGLYESIHVYDFEAVRQAVLTADA